MRFGWPVKPVKAKPTSPIKRHLRGWQTHTPWVRAMKFGLGNAMASRFGLGIQPELHLLRHLAKTDLLIDVGANWGQSICAMRRLCPDARIVSFEPNGALIPHLQRQFARDAQVDIRHLALGRSAGEAMLHVPIYRDFIFDGLAATDPDAARGWLNPERMAGFDPRHLSLQSFTVPSERLDALGLRPDFIKIDVQGGELAVLEGVEQTLSLQPVVVLEAANLDIARHLARFELFPYRYCEGRLVMMSPSANTVFMARHHVEQSGLGVARAA